MISRDRIQFIVNKVSHESSSDLTSEFKTKLENELTRALTEEYEGQNGMMLVLGFISAAQGLMKQGMNPDVLASKLQYHIVGVPYIYHKFLHHMIFYAYEYGKAEGNRKVINPSIIETVHQKLERSKTDHDKDT